MSANALSLDAAGTLIEVAAPVAETYATIAAEFAIPVDPQALGQRFKTLFPRMTPLAFGPCDAATLDRQERSWWKVLVRNCLGAHGQHPQFSAFFDALYEYYASADAWRLYPEVRRVLEATRADAIPCVVVSNFDSRLPAVLVGLGIADFFAAIIYSSAAGHAKPNAAIFHHACDQLGITRQGLLHVGDNRMADYEGARGAGCRALWLRREAQPSKVAIPTIGSLESALEVVSADPDEQCRES